MSEVSGGQVQPGGGKPPQGSMRRASDRGSTETEAAKTANGCRKQGCIGGRERGKTMDS